MPALWRSSHVSSRGRVLVHGCDLEFRNTQKPPGTLCGLSLRELPARDGSRTKVGGPCGPIPIIPAGILGKRLSHDDKTSPDLAQSSFMTNICGERGDSKCLFSRLRGCIVSKWKSRIKHDGAFADYRATKLSDSPFVRNERQGANTCAIEIILQRIRNGTKPAV